MSASNGFADRAAFQSATGQRRYKTIPLPIVGAVRIRSLDAREWAEVQAELRSTGGRGGRAQETKSLQVGAFEVIRRCVVDGDGNPVFTDDDRDMVLGLDTAITATIEREVLDFCGLSGEELEDLAKNSGETPGGSSPSG